MYRSFKMTASPGSSTSWGYSAMTWLTIEGIDPRCPGLKSPCAIMRPRASKSAAEKSRPSLTAWEYAVFLSAVPASSAIECSAAQTTPFVIASTPVMMAAIRSLPHDVNDQVAVLVHRATVIGKQHGSRLALFDDGRSHHRRARAQTIAVVHRAVDPAARFRNIHRT